MEGSELVNGDSGLSVSEVPVATNNTPEKLLTQSQVNDIVKREKSTVAAKLREQVDSLTAKINSMESSGGMEKANVNVDEFADSIYQKLQEKFAKEEEAKARQHQEQEQLQYQQNAETFVKQFYSRLEDGSKKYADFDELRKEFDPNDFSYISMLAAAEEDTVDLMYKLMNDPKEAARLDELAKRSPKLALKDLKSQKLAKEESKSYVAPNAPLQRIKQTNLSRDSAKQLSVADFKKMDWLRG